MKGNMFVGIVIYNCCFFSILVISGFLVSSHGKLSKYLFCFLPPAFKIEYRHFKDLCHSNNTRFPRAQNLVLTCIVLDV
jgi:hypothetical protein